MTILSKPWRIDRRGERIYVDAPGEVCVDICSGTPEDRARVMALLEQVQAMARVLAEISHDLTVQRPWHGEVDAVLRAAGVFDE